MEDSRNGTHFGWMEPKGGVCKQFLQERNMFPTWREFCQGEVGPTWHKMLLPESRHQMGQRKEIYHHHHHLLLYPMQLTKSTLAFWSTSILIRSQLWHILSFKTHFQISRHAYDFLSLPYIELSFFILRFSSILTTYKPAPQFCILDSQYTSFAFPFVPIYSYHSAPFLHYQFYISA